MDGFMEKVAECWKSCNSVGDPMVSLWQKLKKLQPILREMSRKVSNVVEKIPKARCDLEMAQKFVAVDATTREIEGRCRTELMKWLDVEEKFLAHKVKITWLKLVMVIIDISMHQLGKEIEELQYLNW